MTCREFFDSDKLIAMLDEHVNGKKNYARILYTVYAFIVWYEVYFVNEVKRTDVVEADTLSKRESDTVNELRIANRNKKAKVGSQVEGVHTDNFRL